MKIKPLGDKVLVQRLAAEEKTTSGLYLPESAQEKPQQAKVLAVGTGRILDNGERAGFQVKPGDIVVLNKWGGTEISMDSEDYLILGEEEILAVVG